MVEKTYANDNVSAAKMLKLRRISQEEQSFHKMEEIFQQKVMKSVKAFECEYSDQFLGQMELILCPQNEFGIKPATVASPHHSLKTRCANSLESSLVLCSFLLGAGYNAYVVTGYAKRNICQADKSNLPLGLWQVVNPTEIFYLG
ncbi:Dynein regulatory complex subunit 7 [Nymphon striatum]|nr:Dynein regulatory complex subunit 7 [Nymphon striatum]